MKRLLLKIATVATAVGLALSATVFAADTDINATIKGSDVMIIGDSFFALSDEITRELERLARQDGVIGSNETFKDCAVSGATLANNGIPGQYKNGISSGKVKYVIMDGGGNDCLQGSGGSYTASTPFIKNATDAVTSLLKQMKADGVVKVFYLFYPDPNGDLGGLKAKLDALRPIMQSTVANATDKPETIFFDIRPTWSGKLSQYTLSDGIHPTTAGSQATAQAMWAEMKRVKFFETTPIVVDKCGDANKDGSIDALDFSAIKQYLMKTGSAYNSLMDLNADNAIDAIDLALMKKYLLGSISTLPVK